MKCVREFVLCAVPQIHLPNFFFVAEFLHLSFLSCFSTFITFLFLALLDTRNFGLQTFKFISCPQSK